VERGVGGDKYLLWGNGLLAEKTNNILFHYWNRIKKETKSISTPKSGVENNKKT
jgi:hypothetical protein